jgi:hypothetical protein
VLAHFSAGIGNELVAVLKRDAEAGIRQHFVYPALHFDQFFFSQWDSCEDMLKGLRRRSSAQWLMQRPAAALGQRKDGRCHRRRLIEKGKMDLQAAGKMRTRKGCWIRVVLAVGSDSRRLRRRVRLTQNEPGAAKASDGR